LFRSGSERPKKAVEDTAKASETEKYDKSIDNCPRKDVSKLLQHFFFLHLTLTLIRAA
jgi:hypothetical protein